ncbi:hypothetical protein [Rhodoplanes azumiensis]|uniref:Uncharacterized protein n=1 Tax=Rhodoplanes azumiensis TaxID=1897628 RepID=A0ABW5AMZ2_9BRAD
MRNAVGLLCAVVLGLTAAACTRSTSPAGQVVASAGPGEMLRDELAARRERRPACEQQARELALSPSQRASFVWSCVNR